MKMYKINNGVVLSNFFEDYFIINTKLKKYLIITKEIFDIVNNLDNYKYDNKQINNTLDYLFVNEYLYYPDCDKFIKFSELRKKIYLFFDQNNFDFSLVKETFANNIVEYIHIFIINAINKSDIIRLIDYAYNKCVGIFIHADYRFMNYIVLNSKFGNRIEYLINSSSADETLKIKNLFDNFKFTVLPLYNEKFKENIYYCLQNKINFNFNTFPNTNQFADMDNFFADYLEIIEYLKIMKKDIKDYRQLRYFPLISISDSIFFRNGIIIGKYNNTNKCCNCGLLYFCEQFNVNNCNIYKKALHFKVKNLENDCDSLVKHYIEVLKNV